MKLPTLYKTSSKGATQVMDIESAPIIDGITLTNQFLVTWGQLDGKLQTKLTVCEEKNIGKKNHTTGPEQAEKEAKAYWDKKQKSNYSTSKLAPVLVELPMKVSVYQKHIKKIKFPCFISPKLNGVNCEYRKDSTGNLILLSRGGETRPVPPHQVDEVHTMMRKLGVSRLNGEMYIHGEFLQDITSAVTKANELSPSLVFHIFDLPTLAGNYERREAHMSLEDDLHFVKIVPAGVANSFDEIDEAFKDCITNQYEGLMVRNVDNEYKYNTRSLSVFKYKEALDAEFLVTSYSLDKNGHAVFTCQSDGGDFKAKPKGTDAERLAMAAIADTYIGQHLKVEYEMLSKDGKPQKPVGIIFRKVDTNGEAIE